MKKMRFSETFGQSWPVVLCIDDDPEIVDTIRLRLRDYEVEVLSAYYGMHGFWQAMSRRPDLIISDVRMPQGNGDYLVQSLRRNTDTVSIPVIVLSGCREPEVERSMRRLGAKEFFTKPAPFDQLQQAVAKYIPLRRRADMLTDVVAES
jgi:two-component system, OmpR family, response regulator RpaA